MIAFTDREIFPLQNKSTVLVTNTDLFSINSIIYVYHALYYLFTYLIPSEYQGFWELDQITSLLFNMCPYL